MSIENLSLKDTVTASTVFAGNVNGQDYRYLIGAILTYMQANLVFPSAGQGEFVTQYASPSATAFNVTISDGDDDDENVHLILTPTAGFAAGTITLPPVASVVDKQEILVNCTQQVTALTIDGNGATAVTGEPTALAADDFFRLKYDAVTSTWYRVG